MQNKNLLESIIDEQIQRKRLNEISQLVKEYDSLDSILIENTSYNRDVQIVVRLDELGAFDGVISEKTASQKKRDKKERAQRKLTQTELPSGVSVEKPEDTASTEEPEDATVSDPTGDQAQAIQGAADSERNKQRQTDLEKTFSRGSMFKFKVGQLAKMLSSAVKSGKTNLITKIKATLNRARGKAPNAPVTDVPGVSPDVAKQVDAIEVPADGEPDTSEPTSSPASEPETTTDTPVDPDQPSLDFDATATPETPDEPSIEPETPAEPSPLQQKMDKTMTGLGLGKKDEPTPTEEPTSIAPEPESPAVPTPATKSVTEPSPLQQKMDKTMTGLGLGKKDEPKLPAAEPEISAEPAPVRTGPQPPRSPEQQAKWDATQQAKATAPKPETPVAPSVDDKPKSLMPKSEPTKAKSEPELDEPKRLIPKVKPTAPTDEPKRLIPKKEPGTTDSKKEPVSTTPKPKGKFAPRWMEPKRGVGDRLKSAWKGFTASAGDDLGKAGGSYKNVFNEIQRLMEQLNTIENVLAESSLEEELTGGQKNLDVAEPYGQLTGADFAKLRARRNEIRATLAEQLVREELYKHGVTLAELNPHQRNALMETVKKRTNRMWEELAEARTTVFIPTAAIPTYKAGQQPTVMRKGEPHVPSDIGSWGSVHGDYLPGDEGEPGDPTDFGEPDTTDEGNAKTKEKKNKWEAREVEKQYNTRLNAPIRPGADPDQGTHVTKLGTLRNFRRDRKSGDTLGYLDFEE